MSKGIGYKDSVVMYSHSGSGDIGDALKWTATLYNNVRVELSQGKVTSLIGDAVTNTCTVKVHDEDLPDGFSLELFDKDKGFFIIAKKDDIGIDRNIDTGDFNDADFDGGLFEYLSKTIGTPYKIHTVEHFGLIPHWHIGGA